MRFFFDNNLGKQLSEGLKAFGEDTCHLQDHFNPDTSDDEWLKFIGEKGWFLISVDKRIRRRPIERQALIDYQVGAFFLSLSFDLIFSIFDLKKGILGTLTRF
jgi:hypothetical protein